MLIAFVTSGLPFTGDSLKTGALGGSETALASMARSFAKRGHDVRVYCECPAPGTYDGVRYFRNTEFAGQAAVIAFDVVIASRWNQFLTTPSDAGLNVLWLHDVLTDEAALMGGLHATDLIMCLSDYHIGLYTDALPDLAPHIWKTRNGIDPELIQANLRQKVPGKMIYSSRAERGLLYLLRDIFPRILQQVPTARLHYCSYQVNNMAVPDAVSQIQETCQQIAAQYSGGVVDMGSLSKEDLYRQISSSQLMVYPSDFPEISPVRGDTLIETLDGRKQIKDLVGQSGFKVYSCDKEGRLSLSEVKGVFLTRKNAEMVKLTVRPGRGRNANKEKVLHLTPDHEVMLRDGTYKPAGQLMAGDRVKAFHRRRNEHGNGYDTVGVTDCPVFPEHRFVASKTLGREIQDGEVVDHLDGDTHNNTPENLAVTTQSQHWHDHWARMTPEQYAETCKRHKEGLHRHMQENPEEFRQSRQRAVQAMWDRYNSLSDEERKAWLKHRVECRQKKMSNHVVVSVEPAESADAFCMEVEPDHNFVANGIFVHNCIGAIEAQACGTPIVTTNDFALAETVGYGGIKLDGSPRDKDYQDRFVDTVVRLLSDEEEYRRLSEGGPKYVKEIGYEWDAIVGQWEHKFKEMLEQRWIQNREKVITNLVRKNDLQVARLMAMKSGMQHRVSEIEAQSTHVSERTETEPEAVKRDIDAMIPRFHKLVELLKLSEKTPTSIVEKDATDASYGLFLAKMFPEAKVVLEATTEETCERLLGYVDETGAEVEVTTELPVGEKYDLVILPDVLDAVFEPSAYLKHLTSLVADGGQIAVTVRVGTDNVFPGAAPNRLWNFDYQDLANLSLHDEEFRATFHDEKISDAGEIVGHWIGLLPKKEKYGKLDIKAKALRTRPYQSLCATVCVKNEEEWIRGVVKSIEKVCDRILVMVDNESTDRTREIAEELGCDVRSVTFDNFGQVHNDALEAVTEDWVLSIDGDERLLGANKLRGYLKSAIFEGYALRQNHLMLDLHGTFDLPVRVFRNRSHYRYTGYIHEHCEDTSKGPFDNPISPTLMIEEVDIAHYGYVNERMRRHKCSSRNMELLIRDVQDNASRGRLLTRVLVIRDYLNMVKWSLEKTGGAVTPGSKEHVLVSAAITDYRHFFGDRSHRYHDISFPMYQEALEILGRNGIPYLDRKTPPFQVGLALTGAVGGLESSDVAPQKRWFVDDSELMEFLANCGAKMVLQLGLAGEEEYKDALTFRKPSVEEPLPDAVELLGWGLGVA